MIVLSELLKERSALETKCNVALKQAIMKHGNPTLLEVTDGYYGLERYVEICYDNVTDGFGIRWSGNEEYKCLNLIDDKLYILGLFENKKII